MDFIRDIARFVEERWRKINYNETEFAKIAECALTEVRSIDAFEPRHMFEWAARTPTMPQQKAHRRQSDFQIRLFDGSRFELELRFWDDDPWAELHNHTYHGAFKVVAGASIQSKFTFQEEVRVSSLFRIGRLTFQEPELLRTGDVRQVNGNAWGHSLFHLDRPSITLELKTKRDLEHDLSFVYHKPGIAVNPRDINQEYVRKSHALRALHRVPVAGMHFEEYLTDLLTTSDFHTAVRLLRDAAEIARDKTLIGKMIRLLQAKHGYAAAVLPAALEDAARTERITGIRSRIVDEEHRFMLALLANAPTWKAVLALIEQRFPDREPKRTAMAWLRPLMSSTPALGLTDRHMSTLEHLVDGATPTGQLRAEVADSFLLKPLFEEDGGRPLVSPRS